MVWEPEASEIERRRATAGEMGGEEAVGRHHAKGELTARERLGRLIDGGTFREYGSLSGSVEYDDGGNVKSFVPSNAVIGVGKLNGRDVVIGAEDSTIRGGASDGGGGAKMGQIDALAIQLRLPQVRLQEAAGGSVRTNRSAHSGRSIGLSTSVSGPYTDLLGQVPVVAAAMGPTAGLPAARMALAHFSVMVKDAAVVFAGGPPVVERALGQRLTKEELGGWEIHLKSGLIDNLADDEDDALRQVGRFLSYLPSNAWELPPSVETDDDPRRRDEALLSLIPRERQLTYDPREIVARTADHDSFFEMSPMFGRAVITGFARFDGYPVGVLLSNPDWLGGAIDSDAANKLMRFVDLCDSFHMPMVSYEDDPGYMVGLQAEIDGTLRHGIRAMAAVKQATIPWMLFIVRKAYGVAAATHHNGMGPTYAWPSGEWGSIPPEGGVSAAYRREIEAAPDPDARRRELEAMYIADRNPFLRAESYGLHDLIDPRETRPIVTEWVARVQGALQTELGPKYRMMRP